MAKDKGFHEYVMGELFADINGITSRSMFGGWGIYKNGMMFAIIDDGQLFFKVGESNQADFEKYGSEPFKYTMPSGKVTPMSYWELPAEIMDDQQELESWIEKSIVASKDSKKKRK